MAKLSRHEAKMMEEERARQLRQSNMFIGRSKADTL